MISLQTVSYPPTRPATWSFFTFLVSLPFFLHFDSRLSLFAVLPSGRQGYLLFMLKYLYCRSSRLWVCTSRNTPLSTLPWFLASLSYIKWVQSIFDGAFIRISRAETNHSWSLTDSKLFRASGDNPLKSLC